MIVPSMTVDSYEEFKNPQGAKAVEFSYIVIETILNNLTGRTRHIPLLELRVNDQNQVFDITIDRQEFISLLTLRFKVLEKLEDFETCVKIQEAIKFLEEKAKKAELRKKAKKDKK